MYRVRVTGKKMTELCVSTDLQVQRYAYLNFKLINEGKRMTNGPSPYQSLIPYLKKIVKGDLDIPTALGLIEHIDFISQSVKESSIKSINNIEQTKLIERGLTIVSGGTPSTNIDEFQISAYPTFCADENGRRKVFIVVFKEEDPEDRKTRKMINGVLCFYFRVWSTFGLGIEPMDIEYINLRIPFTITGSERNCKEIDPDYQRVRELFKRAWGEFSKAVA